jgi:DNA-binding NarL/FixJ family response regulator
VGSDIVLLAVESPAELDLVSAIARRRSLVVISLDQHAVRPVDVMSRGASAYVTGQADTEELDCAFRSVRKGNAFVCCPSEREDWTETSESGQRSRAAVADELTKQLTVRERQVLKHLAAGKTNQEIADFLGLSLKTVEAYRTRLSAKTGLKRKADLVRFAFAAGLWACTPEDYLAGNAQSAAASSSST